MSEHSSLYSNTKCDQPWKQKAVSPKFETDNLSYCHLPQKDNEKRNEVLFANYSGEDVYWEHENPWKHKEEQGRNHRTKKKLKLNFWVPSYQENQEAKAATLKRTKMARDLPLVSKEKKAAFDGRNFTEAKTP